MRRSMSCRLIFLLLFLFGMLSGARATLIDVNFATGPNGWTATGDVQTAGGVAVLGDNNAPASRLYLKIALPHGQYCLDFDFKGQLAPAPATGLFPDTFFASLYFTNCCERFDLDRGVFDGATGLLSLDHAGVFDLNGTISDQRDGWLHYHGTFLNNYAYVIPTFELIDLDYAVDGQVWLGNVQLGSCDVVPEPATLALIGLGLAGLMCFSHRRVKRASRLHTI